MNLQPDLLNEYTLFRPISPGTAYHLAYVVSKFAAFLTHPATTDDLQDAIVSGYLRHLQESGASQGTVCHDRDKLVALWNHAAERGYVAKHGRLRRTPRPVPMPRAWTLEEMRRLLAACLLLPRSEWWQAFLLAGYESGLRRLDLHSLARESIGADGTIWIRQHKTAQPHVCRVRPETAALILALPGDKPLVWFTHVTCFHAEFRRLKLLAGVTGGNAQQLRRTGATQAFLAGGPQGAAEFLGHASPNMWRNYVDRSIAQPAVYLPPRVA